MLIRILPLNSHVGYVAQNRDNIVSAMAEAHRDKIRFLITPECALSGYPPEDLMLRGSFQTALQDAIDDIVKKSQDYNVSLILGAPYYKDGNIYNAALHIEHGKLHIAALKKHLPDHGVFDDSRIFAKGQQTFLTDIDGVSFGVMVCEDMWYPDPSTDLKKLGADALI
ncbi:MAG: nitrilase-related carbon-nitrogen hydrolase, partial [Pseudomonadota bacterium]